MLDLLKIMKKSVLEAPDGALTLGRRQWLWAEVARRYPGDAYVRRAAIGHLVCDQTIPIWESLSLEPTDHRLFYRIRALCQSVLLGELMVDSATTQFTHLDGHARMLDSILIDQNKRSGFFTLRAAWSACLDAIRPTAIPTATKLDLTDAEIDPDELDPHFLVSCAMAGGATWEPSSDPEMRRAFWIKWLDELFPLSLGEPSALLALVKS